MSLLSDLVNACYSRCKSICSVQANNSSKQLPQLSSMLSWCLCDGDTCLSAAGTHVMDSNRKRVQWQPHSNLYKYVQRPATHCRFQVLLDQPVHNDIVEVIPSCMQHSHDIESFVLDCTSNCCRRRNSRGAAWLKCEACQRCSFFLPEYWLTRSC